MKITASGFLELSLKMLSVAGFKAGIKLNRTNLHYFTKMKRCNLFFMFAARNRAVSSVGLEHRLDKAGVSGSSPLRRTLKSSSPKLTLGTATPHSRPWEIY